MSLRDQLSTSKQRSSTLEAELGQRDRQLVRKCDALQLTETQVGLLHSAWQNITAWNDYYSASLIGNKNYCDDCVYYPVTTNPASVFE